MERTMKREREKNPEDFMMLVNQLVEGCPFGCSCCRIMADAQERVQDYVFVEVNKVFADMFGKKREEIIGEKISSAFPCLSDSVINELRTVTQETALENKKHIVRYVSILHRIYRITFFTVGQSMLIGIYEDMQVQAYRKFYRRRIPAEVVSRSICERHREAFLHAGQKEEAGEKGLSGFMPPAEMLDEDAIEVLPEPMDLREETDAVFRDSLTGLYDRRFAVEALKLFIERDVKPLSIALGDINGLKLLNDARGYMAGDEMLARIASTLRENCPPGDLVARWSDDEFLLLLPHTTGEQTRALLKRLRAALGNVCEAEGCASMTFGYATNERMHRTDEQMIHEAEKWVYRKKLLETKSYRNSIIKVLLSTLHEKSMETQEHSRRMADYCRRIASVLALSDEVINDLVLLAMLHDIGKVGIRHEVLNKPGALTKEERCEIQLHPEIGYRITKNIPELSQVANYILAHHEWWDGSGYPRGLRGEDIPIPSRIIAVVDAYDVMVSGRIYRAPRSCAEAIAELRLCTGTQFDPTVVGIFIKLIEEDHCATRAE